METIVPDIICMAKGMGSGFPVGAVIAREQFAAALVPGTHGDLWRQPACAVAATVIEEMLDPDFLPHVRAMSKLLFGELNALKERNNKIHRITGKGLMVGVETELDIKKFIPALREAGLMTTQAGADLIRLTPPLIAEEKHIKEAVGIIEDVLKAH